MRAPMPDATRRRPGLVLLAVLLALAVPPRSAGAAEALAAVAANFADTLAALRPVFTEATGHRLETTIGATGKLYAQIRAGAPFDLLLSADAETPAELESAGLAVPGSRFTYAYGRLVLWSADPHRIGADGRTALRAPDLRHVAIANPRLAPYGAAARAALKRLGLWTRLEDRIVLGQNVGQAQALAATGNAELAFVALSAATTTNRGSHWAVPPDLYPPIRQDAALLRAGADNPAARAFLDFLKTPGARAVIARHGYGLDPP